MKLLELFKELSLHPKNAAELKALILQLAVQGKLTAKWREENPDVEPASNLLKRISTEKQQLTKAGKIKKENPLPPIKAEEIPFELPKGWVWCRLGELSEKLGAGSTPSGGKASYVDSGIKFFRSQNIYNDGIRINDIARITPKVHQRMNGTHIKPKDILLNITGGSIGRCALVPDGFDSGNVSQHVAIVRLIELSLRHYIHKFIISPGFQEKIMDVQVGVSREGLSMTKLKMFATPLPSLKEQHAIVNTVNQLFAEVEQLEQLTKERIQLKHDFAASALHRLVKAGNINGEWAAVQQHFHTFFNEKPNVKKLRETILQLAVQGKLTTHWRKENPGVEPATELLKRITAEKQALVNNGKIKKEKPLPPVKDDEIPFELPEGWVWCRLGEVIRFMAYGTSQKTNDDYKQVPVLRMGNISSDGKLNFNNLKYIPKNHKDLPGLYLANGDIVFNRTNSYELVGKSGVFWGEDKSFTLASYLIKVSVFLSHVLPDYLNLYITSPVCRKTQIEPEITAQTNQANFSGSKLKNVYCPIPPTKEQQAIVTTVNILMALCDALEQELGQQESRVEKLMRSCVREVME